MERTRRAGIKLNLAASLEKIYMPEGVKSDPSKVNAIKKMEAPCTKQELQSF